MSEPYSPPVRYVWVDGKRYRSSYAAVLGHDFVFVPDRADVITNHGAGFLGVVRPDPRGRYDTTHYRPYVILPDGSREDLRPDRNYHSAMAQLTTRLGDPTP
jgi:hypothetical protein